MLRILSRIALLALLAITPLTTAQAAQTICEGQYALCAYAKCIPVPGEKGKVLCTCEAKSGYSLGSSACQTKAKETVDGYQTLVSRYYPVKTYVSCKNKRPWANCYNSDCIVDKNDSSKAFCTCSTVKDKGDYMYATNSCDQKGCDSELISSYLINDANVDIEKVKKLQNSDKLPISQIKPCT